MNYLTKNQLAIIIFFLPLVFKMSMLPSLLYETSGADSYFAIGLITAIEFLQMWLVLYVVDKGGIAGIKELYGKAVAIAISLPFFLVMGLKSVLFVTEIYVYVGDYLFYNVSFMPLIVSLLIIVCYLASKGAKTIGRIFELSVWLIPIIILLGVLFGKVKLYPQYLTPLFDNGFGTVIKGIDKYIIYAFDFSPLLFFRVEKKKNVRVLIGSLACVIAVVSCYIVLIASYGRATFLITDAFAHLASFNVVISEIGSLDWPSAILWLTTSIGNVALKISAMSDILAEMKIKKNAGAFVLTLAIGLIIIFLTKGFDPILDFATGPVKYVVIGIEILAPIIILALYAVKKKEVRLEAAN